MVAALLRCALEVRICVWGNAQPLVRHARLLGLICNISRSESTPAGAGSVTLTISGPFSLFKQTQVYASALASLLPRVASCDEFEISAECAPARGQPRRTLIVRSSDPVALGRLSAGSERRVEELFAKAFASRTSDWELIRQPELQGAPGALVVPDFELSHRREPERRWFLEIVGFWTAESLAEKVRRIRAARLERYILCIDEKRCCGKAELPADACTLLYRRRIDPAAILTILASRDTFATER
jgi:predicted nuclease of restriction endonuclease-like RecB superfamily